MSAIRARGDARCRADPRQREHVADVGQLYRVLAGPLERIVRLDVRAPDPVIEDACQFAWTRLVCHAERVHREAALSWLARTAVHEAFKLIGRDRREVSLEAMLDSGGESVFALPGPAPEEVVEWR